MTHHIHRSVNAQMKPGKYHHAKGNPITHLFHFRMGAL